MIEFTVQGNNYRAGKLDAFAQLHVSRKLAPVLPKLFPILGKLQATGTAGLTHDLEQLGEVVGPLADALAVMPKDDVDLIATACLGVVQRQQGEAWSPIYRGGVFMFSDIDLGVMLPVVVHVIRDSLGNFIAGFLSKGETDPAA